MRYYGQTDDGVNMSHIFSDPDDIITEAYTKETDSDGFLSTKVNEWLPYDGIFEYSRGIVYKEKFISEEAYTGHHAIESDGIPAILYKEYHNGIECSIYVCKENTLEKLTVKEIVLISNIE